MESQNIMKDFYTCMIWFYFHDFQLKRWNFISCQTLYIFMLNLTEKSLTTTTKGTYIKAEGK